MSSEEHVANIPELNWIILLSEALCSLIIKSGWNVVLLYIIIDLSSEPDINLPSFKIDKQNIQSLW